MKVLNLFPSSIIQDKILINQEIKKIDSFIQLGSGGEYGKISSPHKESDSGSPKATYAKAKLLATKYLVNLHKINRFPCTILRLYQAYGPKQDTNRFLPVLITNCLKNMVLLIMSYQISYYLN